MKGLAPLFIGIFGTFAFSWVGLTFIPNWQIGHLNPQMEEDGTDVYPQPQSGMVERGARVYAANGCIYCHSQQVRPDYAGADIERKWGDRRSAPRDYIFERPVFLGKMRMGQDLANIGARAPAEQENAPPAGAASPTASPAPQGGAAAPPAPSAAPSGANPSPTANASSPAAGAPRPKATASPSPAGSPATSLAAPPASPAPSASTSPGPNAPPASPTPPAAANASPAAGLPWPVQTSGQPPMYSAAWHHVHLYSPRSINVDSNMPSYRFLYQTRRITDAPSADALKLTGSEAPTEGWEIVPTYDAKCLVAYLMSLNQSHPLKGIRSAATASSSPSPAASPAK
jgi:cbb3-type cytochrome oxidase cytochrome c subunit